MKRFIAPLLLSLPALLLPATSNAQREPLVIADVTVIDVGAGTARPDTTVVVADGRITDVGDDRTIQRPHGAKVIDARGKFLIPGLWDMHVHWYDKQSLTLFTANGVTGVRQMFGNPDLLRWREEIARGSLLGPRMVVASPIIDGSPPVWPNSIVVRNEAEGRNAVIEVKQQGADFVKVYTRLPRDAYFAIADEARRQGIPFVGHVPSSISAAEASAAGQKSIEHLTGILMTCSDDEAELRNEMSQARSPEIRAHLAAKVIDTYSPRKATELFDTFVKHETWQCPTLTLLRSTAYQDDQNFRNDPRLAFIPHRMLERWSQRDVERSAEGNAIVKRGFQKELQVVGDMRHAGVQILAGTDTGNPFCFPGFSLHDELALLVQAGLTEAEALRAATLNPARFLGLEQTLGTIERGKIADLVLLGANPLADIRNTQKIDAVIAMGRLLDRKSLDRMLIQGREAAAKVTR